MMNALLVHLRCPATGAKLDIFPFQSEATSDAHTTFGVLKSRDGDHLYPILDGVPVLMPNSFPRSFLDRFASEIAQIASLPAHASRNANEDWSFSDEWEYFYENKVTTTWGMTAEERLSMLYLETLMSESELKGALICDAGCGNGILTDTIASVGATVIGIDRSSGVHSAQKKRRMPSVHYVQGDLGAPPFSPDIFDLVISNGVLHHTPETRKTFNEVAALVKPGGKLYVWLYRHSSPANLKYRLLALREPLIRPWCSRMPPAIRKAVARTDAALLWTVGRFSGRSRTFDELMVGSMDNLTPRYAWRHNPVEIAEWFFLAGFSAPYLTHWDNPNGVGMVAVKKRLQQTPGVRFGKTSPV